LSILPVVRRGLEEFVVYWNTHHIRPLSAAFCPSGCPDDLFAMPHIYAYTWGMYHPLHVQVERTVCNHSTGALFNYTVGHTRHLPSPLDADFFDALINQL